jgi:hypothetical protein
MLSLIGMYMPSVKKSLSLELNKVIKKPDAPGAAVKLRAIHMRGYLEGLFPAKLQTKGTLPEDPSVEVEPVDLNVDMSGLIGELDGSQDKAAQ